MLRMLQFASFAARHLRKERYDRVFVLTSIPSILLSRVLRRNYSRRYAIDVRDYSYEHFSWYYRALDKVMHGAAFVVISSPGFKSFLPPHGDLVVCHNVSSNLLQQKTALRQRERVRPVIRISYAGYLGNFENNVQLLNHVGNHPRFHIHYAGEGPGSRAIQGYCAEKGFANVSFSPRFSPEDAAAIYQQTDMVYNLYGSNIRVARALSNKLYAAAICAIPILVTPGSFMDEISTAHKFGCPVNLNAPNLADHLSAWYDAVNWESLEKGCDALLDSAARDNAIFESRVRNFVLG
jgi:hypothetical protein